MPRNAVIVEICNAITHIAPCLLIIGQARVAPIYHTAGHIVPGIRFGIVCQADEIPVDFTAKNKVPARCAIPHVAGRIHVLRSAMPCNAVIAEIHNAIVHIVPCPLIVRQTRVGKIHLTAGYIVPRAVIRHQADIACIDHAVYIVIPCAAFLYQPVFNRFRCGGRRIRLCGHYQICF